MSLRIRFGKGLARVAGAAFLLGASAAQADIFADGGVDLGVAGRTNDWAIFALDQVSLGRPGLSHVMISGDLALAAHHGSTKATNVLVNGDAFLSSGSQVSVPAGWINGTVYHDPSHDAMLLQGMTDAQNASDFAFGLTASPGYATSIYTGVDTTITATGTRTVLNLKNFVLTGGTFTLQGTANQCFIINVSRQFSLTGGASIVLAGGLVPADVLFNVHGRGKKITIQQGSSLSGILLATRRTVKISDTSSVTGEVIAARVKLLDAGQITAAAFVSQ